MNILRPNNAASNLLCQQPSSCVVDHRRIRARARQLALELVILGAIVVERAQSNLCEQLRSYDAEGGWGTRTTAVNPKA
jgi:hypothetical protein